MHDCGFTKDNKWFRYRAAAIIVENDCVLFACNEKGDYFYSSAFHQLSVSCMQDSYPVFNQNCELVSQLPIVKEAPKNNA